MLQSATMHKACLAPLGRGFRACVGRAKIPALLCCRLAGVIADLIGRNEPSERRKLFIELQAEGRRIFFGGGRNQQLRWQAANTVLSLGTKIVTSAFRSVFRVVRKWYACSRKWIVSRLKQLYDRLGEEGCPRLHFLKANCSDVIFPVVAEFGATLLVIQDARLLLIAFLVLLHHRFHAFLKVSCLLIRKLYRTSLYLLLLCLCGFWLLVNAWAVLCVGYTVWMSCMRFVLIETWWTSGLPSLVIL